MEGGSGVSGSRPSDGGGSPPTPRTLVKNRGFSVLAFRLVHDGVQLLRQIPTSDYMQIRSDAVSQGIRMRKCIVFSFWTHTELLFSLYFAKYSPQPPWPVNACVRVGVVIFMFFIIFNAVLAVGWKFFVIFLLSDSVSHLAGTSAIISSLNFLFI